MIMAQVSDEPNSMQFNIGPYMEVVRRRYLHFLIPLFFGWLVVWGASWVLRPLYKSGTLILVEQPSLPANSAGSALSEDLQNQLESITQQFLSRTRLLTIIDKFQLYSRGGLTPEGKVNRMRKDINIELVRASQTQQITAFTLYYSAHDPHIAQQVTGELLNLFINGNSQIRQQESEGTTKAIESQLEDARANLAQQGGALQAFEEAHQGALPSQGAASLQILSGLQAQLQIEQDALNAVEQQRISLETLIAQSPALGGMPLSSDGLPADLQEIDQELYQLRSKLANLQLRYTDRYPDVQSVQDEIARLERRRSEILPEPRGKVNGGGKSDPSAPSRGAANSSINSPMPQLQRQLQANQSAIETHQRVIAGLRGKINSYQARLDEEPAQAQKSAELSASYDQAKAQYNDLLIKKSESEMTTSMEHIQKGGQFVILDPPSLPLKPDFPNHFKFCGIGMGVGLALGLVVVGGFELMDDRLYSEKEIRSLLPMAVVSEIPEVLGPSEEQITKTTIARGWAAAVMAVVAMLAGSVFSYLHN
jgi:polysaccharide biosynthesis transport protein